MGAKPYNLKDYRFLVIDDLPLVRQSLRSIIQTMGGFAVDAAQGYTDAINRIRNAPPDVILCDYILGPGRTGQQLLEEVRRDKLIPDESIFIMVTGEQSYEQVVACVELVPDDYIIKPCSPELLSLRLDRLLVKKQVMRPYYVARREKRYGDAAKFLKDNIGTAACRPYRIDFLRCGAELLLDQNHSQAAEQAYREILEIHQFPWANVGIVKALMQQRRFEEARELIDSVVAAAPMFFEASDIKAEICSEMGDYEEAQRTLQETDARNSRNYRRKRRLAEVATINGDSATARAALEDVLKNDVLAADGGLKDYLAMARMSFEAGDETSAELALRKIAPDAPMELDDRLSFLALNAAISPDRGRAAFVGMREAWLGTPMIEERLVDALRAALAIGEPELADAIAHRLMNEEGVRRVFQAALAVYARHGREKDFRNIQRKAALSRIAHEPKADDSAAAGA